MASLQLTSDAPDVARRLAVAASQLDELEAANEAAGAIVTAAPAPRLSGRLGASVRAAVDAHGLTAAGHTSYWTFVHWGAPGRNIVAQPWLLQQTEDRQADIVAVYAEHAATVVANI